MPTERPLRSLLIGVLAALLAIAACGDDGSSPPPGAGPDVPADSSVLSINATRVAKFDSTITAMVPVPDSGDLLVAERVGKIHRLAVTTEDGFDVYGEPGDVVVDVTASTTTENERGLLGLAISADGERLLYVHTALDGAVELWTTPLDDLGGDATRVLSIPHPFIGHNGGDVITLPDGDHLLSIGDMHVTDVDPPYAQDPRRTLGGLLLVPAGLDPFEPTDADMVARGLRNPWRIHHDAETGELWIADVGESTVEEIDRVDLDRLLAGPQLNFGWPYLEGNTPFEGEVPAGLDVTAPFVELPRDGEGCAVIGGAVYRGSNIPGIIGDYVFGDACSSNLRVLRMSSDRGIDANEVIGVSAEWPVAFATDSTGELFVLGVEGGLYRIDPQGWEVEDRPATTLAPVPTTEAPVPELAAAACGIPALFAGLQAQLDSTPEEVESALADTTTELHERVKNLPPELASHGAILESALAEIVSTFEEADWVPTPEIVEQVGTSMSEGSGAYTDFPTAIQRIGAADDASCGGGG